MQKHVLLSLGFLLSCNSLMNSENCVANPVCTADQFCDPLTETCQTAPLAVIDVTPPSGSRIAANDIAITGTGFKPGITVQVDGVSATAVQWISPTKLTARTAVDPTAPGRCGPVDVTVTNPDTTTAFKRGGFRYTNTAQFSMQNLASSESSVATADQLIITDMDNDQQQDAVIKGAFGVSVCYNIGGSIRAGTTPGHCTGMTPITSNGGKTFARIVDFNHNGKKSILIITKGSPNAVDGIFLRNNGSMGFDKDTFPLSIANISDLLPVERGTDVNPRTELWVATDKGITALQVGTSTTIAPMVTPISSTLLTSMELTRTETATAGTQVVGIVSNEGTSGGAGGGLRVLEQSVSGEALTTKPYTAQLVSRLRAFDLDGDGMLDLVGVTDTVIKFYSAIAQSGGSFSLPAELKSISAVSTYFDVADLSCGGAPGLILTSSPKNISYLPGHADGTFATQGQTWMTPEEAATFAVKDVTGDGRPDFVYVTATGAVKVMVNIPQ